MRTSVAQRFAVNQFGIRVGHIIRHPNFEHGCQRKDSPGGEILVGFQHSRAFPDHCNGMHDISRGHVPFEVLRIEDLDESDSSGQLEGVNVGFLPAGAKVVSAVRLVLELPYNRASPRAERIKFCIGEYAGAQNLPIIERASRLGRRVNGNLERVEAENC